jgi:3-hydroxyisobutyrate dehydrogenase
MGLIIGWIGTGVMGVSMCGHILTAGHHVHVYNRSKEKTKMLLDKGAIWCESPQAVAKNSDIIFTIVGFPQDVEETYFGAMGIFAGIKHGHILVDMTTSNPSIASKIADRALQEGAAALDAPVSGGDVGAKNATLAIMVGGAKNAFDTVLPFLRLMGQNIELMGEAGAGQHTKMANQIHIASTMVGVVECLLYAQKAGLNLTQMIDVIGKGAAASWSLNNLGRRIVDQNFNPGFYIKHFVKDMGIALEEAKRMQLMLPGLSLAHQFYIAAMAQGLENLGTHGLYKVLASMNNMYNESNRLL